MGTFKRVVPEGLCTDMSSEKGSDDAEGRSEDDKEAVAIVEDEEGEEGEGEKTGGMSTERRYWRVVPRKEGANWRERMRVWASSGRGKESRKRKEEDGQELAYIARERACRGGRKGSGTLPGEGRRRKELPAANGLNAAGGEERNATTSSNTGLDAEDRGPESEEEKEVWRKEEKAEAKEERGGKGEAAGGRRSRRWRTNSVERWPGQRKRAPSRWEAEGHTREGLRPRGPLGNCSAGVSTGPCPGLISSTCVSACP